MGKNEFENLKYLKIIDFHLNQRENKILILKLFFFVS